MSDPYARRAAARPQVSRAAARAAARRARRRRQLWIVGTLAVALLVLLSGWGALAVIRNIGDGSGQDDTAGGQRAEKDLLADPAKALLDPATAKQLAAGNWFQTRNATTDDVREREFICQAQRFADPAGLRTWVRVLRNPNNLDTATQYVEVSTDTSNASAAYKTITGWLSDCNSPQTWLVNSWVIKGLGEKGVMAVFRVPYKGKTAYRTLSVVNSGPATMVLEHHRIAAQPPDSAKMLAGATAAMQRICAETGSPCGDGKPTLQWQLLPTTEPPGFMAPMDLPVVGDIDKPWVGVKASNRDGTGCEKLDVKAAKATKSGVRTYVVPEAATAKEVPPEFGLDMMVAQFANYSTANRFVVDVINRVDDCKKNFSTASVERTAKIRDRGISGQTWRLQYDTGQGKLTYRVGIVRVNERAVYVMFPVLDDLDVSDATFAQVVIRAGERSLYFR
jgi:hypothetical protein